MALSQRDQYGKDMQRAFNNTKVYGLIPKAYRGSSLTPMKSTLPKKAPSRTMSSKQKALRKQKMIANAADKMMFRSKSY